MPGRHLKPWGYLLLFPVAVLLGTLGAVGGFFAAAFVTSSIPLLVLSGALALVFLTGSLSGLAYRGVARYYRPMWRWLPPAVTAGTLLLVGVSAALLVFQPMGVTYIPKEPTDQTRYWDLPTGSRLAYSLTPAGGKAGPVPVIMLHGGPGAPGNFTPQPEDKALARAGFDVYRYDQAGSGLSERLEDVTQYTVDRHVADLEAIRQEIGAERLILVGSSWGGTLAAHYMAAHPDRVEKTVFSSPGPIWPPSLADAGASGGPETEIIFEAATPRFAVVFALQQINPKAAHNLASDREMSGFFQPLIGRIITADATGCSPDGEAVRPPAKGRIPEGFGYYANMMTAASVNRVDDPRPELRELETPVLILRGGCDRLRWEVTHEYQAVFNNSTLLVVDGASHTIAASKPSAYAEILDAFLREEALPIEPRSD